MIPIAFFCSTIAAELNDAERALHAASVVPIEAQRAFEAIGRARELLDMLQEEHGGKAENG